MIRYQYSEKIATRQSDKQYFSPPKNKIGFPSKICFPRFACEEYNHSLLTSMIELLRFTLPTSTVFRRMVGYYHDREYFKQLLKLGAPIALQSFVMSFLNMVGSIMIGQKGTAAVAAVGLANQLFFLLTMVIFGITSGTAIFTAQLWGKQDIPNIRKVLSLSLQISLITSVGFMLLAEFFPLQVLQIYSKDLQVVALGSDYLRIYGWSFIFYAITVSFSSVHRSIGNVRLPLFFNALALGLNTILSYVLIFGRLGLPAMGVNGAAIAILISRIVECLSLIIATYLMRSPISLGLRELMQFNIGFIVIVLKPVLPVALNELLWSAGITAYNVIYARMGTEAIASINIIGSIDSLLYGIFAGISNATAIMVGNRIGAGKEEEAHVYAGRALGLEAVSALFVGSIIYTTADSILRLYKVSPAVIENAQQIIIILCAALWLRAMNSAMVIGILRGGGDTHFCLFLDGLIIWLVGVPMATLGAFILHLPVTWVYLLVLTEEVVKFGLGLQRYLSKRWIHNLAQTIQPVFVEQFD